MAESGAIVLCVDNNKTFNEKTVEYIKRRGGSATAYTYDIKKKQNVQILAEKVIFICFFLEMIDQQGDDPHHVKWPPHSYI